MPAELPDLNIAETTGVCEWTTPRGTHRAVRLGACDYLKDTAWCAQEIRGSQAGLFPDFIGAVSTQQHCVTDPSRVMPPSPPFACPLINLWMTEFRLLGQWMDQCFVRDNSSSGPMWLGRDKRCLRPMLVTSMTRDGPPMPHPFCHEPYIYRNVSRLRNPVVFVNVD